MPEFKNLKQLLTAAGLSVMEAAPLFKVTRPTIYHWIKGNVPPQQVVKAWAVRMMTVISAAVAANDLPLQDVAKADRPKVINGIIRKHLNNLNKSA